MVGGTNPPASSWRKRVKQSVLILLSAATIVAGCSFDIAPVQAQIMRFPVRPQAKKPRPATTDAQGEKKPMLLQAIEIHYDYNNKRVYAFSITGCRMSSRSFGGSEPRNWYCCSTTRPMTPLTT